MDDVRPLVIDGLTKVIGKRTIVSNLSLTVNAGEVFGFLGPNGAGKTTTIRMLVGLIFPTRGTISIMGYDLRTHRREAMRHVGSIVENPAMYRFLTGRQNLLHAARLIGPLTDAPGDEEVIDRARIEAVIDLVGLRARIDDKVSRYSLGMRQRLGIAQALLAKPSLLVLDEPTNGLDPAGIRELRELLRRLAHDEGAAVFVSSHLLAEVELMCDRVAILDHGEILAVEDVRALGQAASFRVEVLLGAKISSRELLKSKILSLASVTQCEVDALSVENDTARWKVLVSLPEEDVPALNRLMVSENWDVHAIRPRRATLEEHYLTVTGGTSIA